MHRSCHHDRFVLASAWARIVSEPVPLSPDVVGEACVEVGLGSVVVRVVSEVSALESTTELGGIGGSIETAWVGSVA